jgi:hypothetical protein
LFIPIRNPRHSAGHAASPSHRDREALDFARFLHPYKSEAGPMPGLSFSRLFGIATKVCGREIRELGEIRSKAEVSKIKNEIRRLKRR